MIEPVMPYIVSVASDENFGETNFRSDAGRQLDVISVVQSVWEADVLPLDDGPEETLGYISRRI